MTVESLQRDGGGRGVVAHVMVVGSANVDTTIEVDEHPTPGDTVLGTVIGGGAGGKGLNQAVAAVRAGAATTFVAAVGNDAGGRMLSKLAHDEGITTRLGGSRGPTGAAYVLVTKTGENSIVVVPGANDDAAALRAPLEKAADELGPGDIALVQLEIPPTVVRDALRTAREHGAMTILNAAPSRPLSDEVMATISVLVVNEGEARRLAGADAEDPVTALAARVPAVVVTLGEHGAVLAARGERTTFPAHRVDVVDTTAAGDTFCGALAARLAAGDDLRGATRYAIAAAALAVQKAGAVASVPTENDVLTLLARPRAR